MQPARMDYVNCNFSIQFYKSITAFPWGLARLSQKARTHLRAINGLMQREKDRDIHYKIRERETLGQLTVFKLYPSEGNDSITDETKR